MLNYNLNLLSSLLPFGTASRGSNFKPRFNWDFDERTVGVGAPNMTAIAHASFSINAINSDVYGISSDAGGTFEGSEDTAVTCSITGAGVWPTTGSTNMQLYIAAPGGTVDNSPYFYTANVSYSAALNNGSVSGSILSNSFTASKNFIYFVSGSVVHTKGNPYSPLINSLSTGSYTASWNQNSGSLAQFNIIKDQNVFVSGAAFVTASYTSSFYNDYAFNITASLTASANWPTSQSYLYPTMSITIPEAGVSIQAYQTASIITASFAASTNATYTITASAWANQIPQIKSTIVAVAAGGAGSTNQAPIQGDVGGSGGGGGAAYVFDNNFQIVPNVYYTFNVGSSSKEGNSQLFGQDTSLIGSALTSNGFVPFALKLQGGRTDTTLQGGVTPYINGGDSGTGSLLIDTTTTLINKNNGGTGSWNATNGGAGGGGASSFANGGNAPLGGAVPGKGGAGANGVSSSLANYAQLFGAGGGGAGWDLDPKEIYFGAGGTTGGGRGGNQGGGGFPGEPATFYGAGGGGGASAGLGYDGVIIIQYEGKPLLTFTGTVTTSTENGLTTHLINTGSGTFIYNYQPVPDPNLAEASNIETLVIAGGGAGTGDNGAGGGAGGYRYDTGTYINYNNTYTIVVGAGAIPTVTAGSGSNSYILNEQTGETLLAFGGGNGNGNDGGSGGGGARNFGGGGFPTGSSPVGSTQGTIGNAGGANAGGSGGGASTSGSGNFGGGLGKYDLSFTPIGVCGGGGGGLSQGTETGSLAFGAGQASNNKDITNAIANTGGGGGATGLLELSMAGNGGSGKVQIRYIGNPIATGGTITSGSISGSIYTLHTYTTNGRFLPISGSRPCPTY